ncbi:MAG TPA: sulfurtransferase-like selenium metabolism protein YedF [Candidatus Aquicultor sp.]|jgi:selenium metabolism protein YedF
MQNEKPSTILLLTGETMGRGDDELGFMLLGNFLHLLAENGNVPQNIFLLNAGVKLAVDGEPTVGLLKRLEELGSKILSCKTCVDFFEIEDKLAVGEITTAKVVVESVVTSDKVITM